MKLTTKPASILVIEDVKSLDPIRVITEDFEPGKGRIIIVCYDAAWVGYWGAMSGRSIAKFFVDCDAGYLLGNLRSASGLNRGKQHDIYLLRVIIAVQDALRQRMPKWTPARQAKLVRLGQANALIKAISEHGRRFFWNEGSERLARLELSDAGRLYWVDDYKGDRVFTGTIGGYEHRWVGFSHGGTLKDLARDMRDYVVSGRQIQAWRVGQDCWGYRPTDAAALREKVKGMPILKH